MLSLLSDNWRLVLSMVLALLIGWNIRVPVFKMAILKNFVDKPNKRCSEYWGNCCFFSFFVFIFTVCQIR